MIIEILNEWANPFIKYILHLSLQGGLFFLVIVGFSWLLRHKSATFQYILWSLALVRFLIPPQLPSVPAIETAMPQMPGEFVFRPVLVALNTVQSPSLNWQSYIFLAWVIGIVTFTGILFSTNYRFSKTLKSARVLNSEIKIEKNEGWTRHLKVQLMFLPGVEMPFTYGLFRPKIYLPEAAEKWSHEELKFVVAHEMAHIRRGDLFVIQLQALVQVLFFFHPCVWLANYFANYYRELACDDFSIVQSGGRVVDYSKILLNNLTRIRKKQVACTLTSNFGRNQSILFRRFKHILTKKEEIMLKLSTLQKIVICSLAVLAIVISCGPNLTEPQPDASRQDSQALENSDGILMEMQAMPVGGFKAMNKNLIIPESAKAAHVNGKTLVKIFLDEKGNIESSEITESSGNSECDQAAMRAVTNTKWLPGTKDGRPQKGQLVIPFHFHFDEKRDTDGFIPYDTAPEPIGGFAAIQNSIKIPEAAKKAGIQGSVFLKIEVLEDGTVGRTKIIQSIGEDSCDKAAIAAAKTLKWKPAKSKEIPVKVWISVPFVFGTNFVPSPYEQPLLIGGSAALLQNLQYPAIAKKAGVEGTVLVKFLLTPEGLVEHPEIIKSLGNNGCDEAAIEAIKQSKWKPAAREGKPVAEWVKVPVTFRLDLVE